MRFILNGGHKKNKEASSTWSQLYVSLCGYFLALGSWNEVRNPLKDENTRSSEKEDPKVSYEEEL